MPIDSDISDGDAKLHPEFYIYDNKDNPKDPHNGLPYIRLNIPGDQLNRPERLVRESDKRRFPRAWFSFQMERSEADIVGTSLLQWQRERPGDLTDGQLTELAILKFQTVEQLAAATDNQLTRIAIGGAGLRIKAQSFLAAKNAQISGAELQKTKDELAEVKAMMERLLAGQVLSKLPKKAKGRPRGRPFQRKAEEIIAELEATDEQHNPVEVVA